MLEVRDPREMAADSALSHRLGPRERENTYRLRDRALWTTAPGPVLTRLCSHGLGDTIVLAWNTDLHGTDVQINGAGLARHCLSLMAAGRARVTTAGGQATEFSGMGGAVFRGDRGVRMETSDDSHRFNFWISDEKLMRMLGALAGEEPRQTLVFAAGIDWAGAPAAPLARLIRHLVEEMRQPDRGLAGNPVALAAYTDLVADAMLRRLPHNQADWLARAATRGRPGVAVPAHLRRAEAFMEAEADQPLTLEAVAAAAGCSLRALHLAFRRFRETTPHAALTALRLERARAALAADREASVGAVARRFGFTHPTRFAAAYARRFGETPAETQRRGAPPCR